MFDHIDRYIINIFIIMKVIFQTLDIFNMY